jgi:hypothetical protein
MKLLGKKTSYDNIVAFMKDEQAETDLTIHEKTMLTRWMEAFTLMRNYNSTADAAAILMKRFPGLSRATAYRDCSHAVSLFGDISKATKEGIRHLATEIIRDAIAIARAKNNEDGMMKGGVAIAKVNGVNLTEAETFKWDELEPHTYELALDDQMLKALRSMLKGGKIDLTAVVNAMSDQAEDIDYVEVKKELPDETN